MLMRSLRAWSEEQLTGEGDKENEVDITHFSTNEKFKSSFPSARLCKDRRACAENACRDCYTPVRQTRLESSSGKELKKDLTGFQGSPSTTSLIGCGSGY